MFNKAKWIWLSKEKYPYLQESNICYFASDKVKYKYGVAAFKKVYSFDKTIKNIEISVFGDTKYYLWINNDFIGNGPHATGGDVKMPVQYGNQYSVELDTNEIIFYAQVSLTPTVEMDNSSGRGGFILEAKVVFDDESVEYIFTDNTWQSRCENAYKSPRVVDFTQKCDEWSLSEEIQSIWNVSPSEIKNLQREIVSEKTYKIKKHSKEEFHLELDKIYSAYVLLDINAVGEYGIEFVSSEKESVSQKKHYIKGCSKSLYHSHEMDAVGEYRMIVENCGDGDLTVNAKILFVCYPSEGKGYFNCSDKDLNKIFDVSRWTVKICRQSIELDSPVHQENLHCVGDYMIESLVNFYTTGDYSLTRFDLIRLSNYFSTTDGYMYHNTYALIWFQMLYDYYMYSGDTKIFSDTISGIESVLKRYKSYENSDGIIENVTNYMFVDWVYVDGYSLHSPPKALGQTVLNAFYYNALTIAGKIYTVLKKDEKIEFYHNKCIDFKKVFNEMFFDKDKQLYFDGTGGITGKMDCLPENTSKRYYTIYSNTLAVLYDLCEADIGRKIIDEFLSSKEMCKTQPYFSHYVLEATYKVGLFDEYGLPYLKQWSKLVDKCDKGLKECMYEFKGYNFDYSHGWCATPAYQLMNKISGLEILKPGFEEIRLKPNSLGLNRVDISIPSPKGDIKIVIGNTTQIEVPKQIKVL